MESKKGFTLVELLAVIAILAILVIIALPNVINMYTKARKSAFLTEAQNVLKATSNKFIQESVNGKKLNVVSNDKNSLDLSGEKINYQVKLDSQGKITGYVISNDNYCISSKKEFDKLTVDDVSEECSFEKLNNIVGTLMNKFYEKSDRTDRGLVSSIKFYSDGRVIDGAEKYDVSEAQDNSIIMYVKASNENSSLLDLTIVSSGKISFPEDSSNLFAFYKSSGSAFYANLTNLQFNNSIDTHKVVDMSSMFDSIRANSLDLSDFNTSNVTKMYRLFSGASTLSNLDVSNFDTSNVTDMSYMFSSLGAAEIIGLNSLDTSSVVNVSYMFAWSNVKTLDLRNFDTSKVTDISRMFNGSKAESVDVSSFDTSNVTGMNGVFASSKVKTIDVSNFNTSKVTSMRNMFYGVYVSEIKGIENFDTRNITDMAYMFQESSIDTLDLSSFELSDDALNYGMFWNCKTKTVYAKNENMVNKFKSSAVVPSTLTFVIK